MVSKRGRKPNSNLKNEKGVYFSSMRAFKNYRDTHRKEIIEYQKKRNKINNEFKRLSSLAYIF